MEKKKKIIVALSSLCAVLVAAIVTMGIVWAATSQTITSQIKVTYTAQEISGSLSAKVYFNSDTGVAMTADGTAQGATTVTFDGSTATTSGTLTPQGDTVLLNENGKRFVIYEYVITNASTSTAMSAVLTYADDSSGSNAEDANIKVYAYANTTAVSNPHTSAETIRGASGANLVANHSSLISDTVSASGTKYFYILVEINDLASDAEFSGTFSWALTKANSGS